MEIRPVALVVPAQSTSDGAGVNLSRSLGSQALDALDPFLLLDEFRSNDFTDYMSGFPDHPHRGIETVTYMLAGAMGHDDNQGNTGKLRPGDVQWMTAGRGIIHSEMPEQEEGLMWGFQLWVNLSAEQKMREPRYQEVPAADIPTVELEGGVQVKVIAGSVDGTAGPITKIDVDPTYLDVAVPPGGEFIHVLPASHNGFCYVFLGDAVIGEGSKNLARGNLVVLGLGEAVRIAGGTEAARVLLIAGRPHDEPIVKYGPFVMNTKEEIMQAIDDYNSGNF
jgi:redox-sensitive bicupin YhaK (pirin superfamily)